MKVSRSKYKRMKFVEIKLIKIIQDKKSESCHQLIFEDLTGSFLLPIVISTADALPLISFRDNDQFHRSPVHDLFADFLPAAGYIFKRADIVGFEKGIFKCMATFVSEDHSVTASCRVSDTVAFTMRLGGAIYVSDEIISKIGILLSDIPNDMAVCKIIKTLETKLKKLVEEERYEDAAKVRDRIKTLKGSNIDRQNIEKI